MDKTVPETLEWKAPSHIQHQRSPSWYFFLILVGVALLAYAIYSRSLLTGITFVLIILVILVLSTQKPREITYKITKTGITAGTRSYPFKVIKKFWIFYDPPHTKTLNLETSAYLNNRVVIQLDKQDPVMVKMVLSKYLKEDLDKEESFSDKLARNLKI